MSVAGWFPKRRCVRHLHPTVVGMNTDGESRDPDSRWDEAQTEPRGRGAATPPPAVADLEREMDRRRIALQIMAVVVPWRDAVRELPLEECDLFLVRAHALLNYLDVAVMPYPDLQDALAAARSELASERPSTDSQLVH